MVCRSLGQRLFDHQIMPTHRLTAKSVSFDGESKTEYCVGSWLGSHITRRVHHGVVALAHVPAALVDLAGAAICSLGSVFVTSANAITFNCFKDLQLLSNSINAQSINFWMGLGHSIPGIFNHAVSVLNANAKSNPHKTLICSREFDDFGVWLGKYPTVFLFEVTMSASSDDNVLVRHIVARIAALVSLVIVPIAKTLDLLPALLYVLASALTLGMWEKANTQAYRHLYSVCTIPLLVYMCAILLLSPTQDTTDRIDNFFKDQYKRELDQLLNNNEIQILPHKTP